MSCSACSAPPPSKPVRAGMLQAGDDEKIVIVENQGGGAGSGLIIAIVVIVVIIIIAICVGCACSGGGSSEKVCFPAGSVVSSYSAAPTAPMVQGSIAGGSATSSRLSSLSSIM